MSPRGLHRPVCTPEWPHYGQEQELAAMALDTDFLSLIKPKHVSYRVQRYKALLATDPHPSDPAYPASFNWPLGAASIDALAAAHALSPARNRCGLCGMPPATACPFWPPRTTGRCWVIRRLHIGSNFICLS